MNVETLIAARALQGIGGALLTPGSLAIIQAGFRPEDRARAVGAWSGLGGIAFAIGPFAGGWLIDVVSWRAIFLLNLPLAAVVVLVTLRHVPETADPDRVPGLDLAGAVLGIVGLAGTTFALIEGPGRGATDPAVLVTAAAGLAALAAFVRVEVTSPHPMLPLDIFRSRQFSAANAVTFTVYAALGGMLFLFVVHLQVVLDYSPLESGAAAIPSTLVMLVLSSRAGALAQRIGPRLPMTLGALGVAVAMALLSRVDAGSGYVTGILPGIILFGLALSLMVAPLTATVMAAAPARHAGVASGINNAVARTASLLAVAVLPPLAGLTGDAYTDPAAFADGYRTAMAIAAGLAAVGAVTAFLTVSDRLSGDRDSAPRSSERGRHDHHCAVDAPPLRTAAPGD
jgi:EmrB/QacA subfamily drug resistance transporter